MTVRHVVGFVTDYNALRRLPVARSHLAVVIASSKDKQTPGGVDRRAASNLADSEAMTATILLRRLRDEAVARRGNTLAPLQVVTELPDVMSRKLLDTQPELLKQRFAHSSQLAVI